MTTTLPTPLACPAWCTYHANGDYHARMVASDGQDRVVVAADAQSGREPWVEAWIGNECVPVGDSPSLAIDRLDQLARMFLDAADELRKLQ
jgi:hypothetical protein